MYVGEEEFDKAESKKHFYINILPTHLLLMRFLLCEQNFASMQKKDSYEINAP